MATLTWLGHASFRLDTDDGKRIYVDPFLQGNPKTPDSEKTPERCDIIAITHGARRPPRRRGRHLAEVPRRADRRDDRGEGLARRAGRERRRHARASTRAARRRSTASSSRSTDACHSSSLPDGELRRRAGRARDPDSSGKSVYFAGDTCVFGDMELIARLYKPDRRGAADRRLVHDGPGGGRARARAARQPALPAVPLRDLPAARPARRTRWRS